MIKKYINLAAIILVLTAILIICFLHLEPERPSLILLFVFVLIYVPSIESIIKEYFLF